VKRRTLFVWTNGVWTAANIAATVLIVLWLTTSDTPDTRYAAVTGAPRLLHTYQAGTRIFTTVRAGNCPPVTAQIDTGADGTVVPFGVLREWASHGAAIPVEHAQGLLFGDGSIHNAARYRVPHLVVGACVLRNVFVETLPDHANSIGVLLGAPELVALGAELHLLSGSVVVHTCTDED
jgi:hypothetical protein